jgi:methionyl-tRNA synthetase
MSKSLGNVIDPYVLVDEYGTDALRYYLARHVSPFEDSDFTIEKFKEIYNANLANGLGNLVARIMQLATAYLEGAVPVQFIPFPKEFTEALDKFETNKAADYIWGRIQALDERITKQEPFKVVKANPEQGKQMITELVHELAAIDLMLEPFIPETSQKIIDAIMANKKPDNLFLRKE